MEETSSSRMGLGLFRGIAAAMSYRPARPSDREDAAEHTASSNLRQGSKMEWEQEAIGSFADGTTDKDALLTLQPSSVSAGSDASMVLHNTSMTPHEVAEGHNKGWLWSCRERHNYLRLSAGSVQGGLVVEEGKVFLWGGDTTRPKRKVQISLQVDGQTVFSSEATADMDLPLIATDFILRRYRSLVLRVDEHTAHGALFEGWSPFPDHLTRTKLLEHLQVAPAAHREAERLDCLWTDLPNVMRRLDSEQPATSKALPSSYLRLLQERFAPDLKLSGPAEVASWIFSHVLEDVGKRSMFFLTERLLASLVEPMLNKRILRQEITLALFSFWRRHYTHIDIFSDVGLRTVQYKFATAPFIVEKNNRVLITSDLRAKLSASADPFRQSELPWSWYWMFLHEDQQTANRLHDPGYVRVHAWQETIADQLRPTRLSFNPPAWRAYWRTRAGDRALGFTRFDLAAISLLSDAALPEGAIAEFGAPYWSDRLMTEIYRPVPELGPLSGINDAHSLSVPPLSQERRDLAIVGHFNSSGLGRNFNMFVEALSDLNPLLFNADDGACLNPDSDYRSGRRARAKVVILCVNADRSPDVVARIAHVCEGAYLIGFYLWETDRPPETHFLGASIVDEIWTPSTYTLNAYAKITQVPLTNIKKGLKSPPPTSPLPPGIEKDEKVFTFLAQADFGSGIIRKNPLDVIVAFQRAFTAGEPVQLWLKLRLIEPEHCSNQNGYWEDMEELIAADPRLRLVEGDLSEEDYWSLWHHIDTFVSLHRSEGFGYGLADALACGTPIITSDYSGSTDFCSGETAFLVPVQPEPAPPSCLRVRGYIGNWCRPNIDAASAAMRQVFTDPDAARARAEQGRRRIRQDYDFVPWRDEVLAKLNPLLTGSDTNN